MFVDPSLGESESRAIFVDPISLRVKGRYDGSRYQRHPRCASGLIMRIVRYCWATAGGYTAKLAASWMWVAALGGIAPVGDDTSKTADQ
ncbi:PepSY domain-containing protein [Klebsiella variicola subsp. variicola]|nr:PepSY domain-containing protein [Klebsiella variicola subsp. variicola]